MGLLYVCMYFLYSTVPPPTVAIVSSSQSYYLGEMVTLTCTAAVVPQVDSGTIIATFTWYYDEEELDINGTLFFINQIGPLMSELRISFLSIMDTTFSCSVTLRLEDDPGRIFPAAPPSLFLISKRMCKLIASSRKETM